MKELMLNQETMSSTQLAGLLGKEKKEINRNIKEMFPKEIDGGYFAPSLDTRGYVLDYNLPETETHMFVAKNDIGHLRKLSEYWVQRKAKPLTALQLAKQNVALLEALEVKDTYIIASNEASIKSGEILVREFVKSVDIIDLGEKQFYAWMREQNIILKESNEPYQTLRNRGYFTYKPTEDKHGGKFRYTLRITPRGKVWLAAKYLKYIDD